LNHSVGAGFVWWSNYYDNG